MTPVVNVVFAQDGALCEDPGEGRGEGGAQVRRRQGESEPG